MVNFICGSCQETLRKPVVEKHRGRCHGCWHLTCLDCNADFTLDTYKSHITCISEAEKYEKSLYRGPKAGAGKKVDPQVEWTQSIAFAYENETNSKHGNLLERLLSYDNAPRKIRPFISFAKNSLRIWNDQQLTELFELVQKYHKQRTETTAQVVTPRPDESDVQEKNSSRKRDRDEDANESSNADSSSEGEKPTKKRKTEKKKAESFDMKSAIVSQIKELSKKKEKVKAKKLRKLVLKNATKFGLSKSDAEKDFEKYLAKLVKKDELVSEKSGKYLRAK